MKPSHFLLIFFSLNVFARPMTVDEAWQSDSSPEIMSYYYEKKFANLPVTGKVKKTNHYWSGDYWALKKGNINYRWFAANKIGFGYKSPTKSEALRMTTRELAELSPSEKYDLFTGLYDYPLKNEVYRIANPGASIWEGICHGWSPATMNHPEPKPVLVKNPDGIDIPFGSTDLKALLSYYYAHVHQAPDNFQVGKRCYKEGMQRNDRTCINDLNAGAFHIVMANLIGIDGRGFIADMQRYDEVWNHPFTEYKSQVMGYSMPDRTSAPGTVTRVDIQSVITYVDENGHDWHPVMNTPKQLSKLVTYRYFVELDSAGNVIGGEWISKERPDFLWMMTKPREFVGSLSQLGYLLEE